MLLRTFSARTAAEAMEQVRNVLGDEAIILSTQDDASGGVQVTAALEAALLPLPIHCAEIGKLHVPRVPRALQRPRTVTGW